MSGSKLIMTKKTTIQPVDIEGELKYLCPHCGDEHWLTYLEASTSGFKIVCDCQNVLEIEPITKIQFVFSKAFEGAVKRILKHSGYRPEEINVMIEHAGFCKTRDELLKKALMYNGESIQTETTK